MQIPRFPGTGQGGLHHRNLLPFFFFLWRRHSIFFALAQRFALAGPRFRGSMISRNPQIRISALRKKEKKLFFRQRFYSHQSNSETKVGLRVTRDAQHTNARVPLRLEVCVLCKCSVETAFALYLESILHDLLVVWWRRHSIFFDLFHPSFCYVRQCYAAKRYLSVLLLQFRCILAECCVGLSSSFFPPSEVDIFFNLHSQFTTSFGKTN
jgi:hypothetical protein